MPFTMAFNLVYDTDEVVRFVQSLLPSLARSDDMKAIGLERRGSLVAGVIFEKFSGRNIWMNAAIDPSGHVVTPRFLKAVFLYPFRICGVDRVTAEVVESNLRSIDLCEKLGFVEEARLKGAAQDGGDVILFVRRRQECIYA